MRHIIYKCILLSVLFSMGISFTFGQLPTHYPTGDEPVEINLINILIYIIVPVLMLVFYLYWRKSKKKKKEKEE